MDVKQRLERRRRELKASHLISEKDLDALKYYASDFIPRARLEKISSAVQFFLAWEEAVDSEEGLLALFEEMHRKDILDALTGRASEQSSAKKIPEDAIRNRVLELSQDLGIDKEILDEVSLHIGLDWKRMSRFLGLADSMIDCIDNDHRRTVDRAHEALKIWLRSQRPSDDCSLTLRNVLGKIGRYDIVRCIERMEGQSLPSYQDTKSVYDTQQSTRNSIPDAPPVPAYSKADDFVSLKPEGKETKDAEIFQETASPSAPDGEIETSMANLRLSQTARNHHVVYK